MYLLRIFYDDFENRPYEENEEFGTLGEARARRIGLEKTKTKYSEYRNSEILDVQKVD